MKFKNLFLLVCFAFASALMINHWEDNGTKLNNVGSTQIEKKHSSDSYQATDSNFEDDVNNINLGLFDLLCF